MKEETFLKRKHQKFIAAVSLFLCIAIINSISAAAFSGYRSVAPNAIATTSVHGIVAGETLQLYSSSNDEGIADYDGIWSSSNPDIVSCTPGGSITGNKAGGYADITCTSKSDGSTESFRVYCVRAVPPQLCSTREFQSYIYAQPDNGKLLSVHLNLSKLWNFLFAFFRGLTMHTSPNSLSIITIGSFEVRGQYGNYAYIRFNNDYTSDGFIKYKDIAQKISSFIYLSQSQITVKTGTNEYLKCEYSGTVNWTVENDEEDGKINYENSIIKFDPSTGKITPKKGGATSITASANGMSQTCKIQSIYMWPQEWKVTAEKDITFYELSGVVDYDADISEGDIFYVIGDLGGSDGRCYVRYGNEWSQYYAYAKIEDFSTKGTISQYNELGWAWPVRDVKNGVVQTQKANYIQSPYGWRDQKPKRHQGIDITTGSSGEIAGYDIVSAFDGTVIFCGDQYGYDWGYCVAVKSDCVDPVSGKNFVAVYMHLMDKPNVVEGEPVFKGKTVLGKVGNTTTPGIGMGYHLHFEFNNQTSSIGILSDGSQTTGYGRKSYDYLVNPIFLYTDKYENKEILYNPTSESELLYFKTFWYGNGDEIKDAY